MTDMPLLEVASRAEWRNWLAANHASAPLIWLLFYKAHTNKRPLSYNDAVEEALCFGWIDSMDKSLDADRYAQKFTPRKPKSNWAASNIARVRRLLAEGLMTEAGLAKIPAEVMREIERG